MASRIPLLRELADYLERTTCVYVPREEIQQIAAGTYPPKKLTYLLKTMKTAGCLGKNLSLQCLSLCERIAPTCVDFIEASLHPGPNIE